jgi:hypothetical protein
LHVSASARSPPRCFPHLFPERSLLVFPPAAVAKEVFPRLGRRPASAVAPPAVAGWLIWVRCGALLLREDSLHRILNSNLPNPLKGVQPKPVVVLTSTSVSYIFLLAWYQNT